MSAYTYEKIDLPCIDPVQKEKVLAFAAHVSGKTKPGYIETRLNVYKELVIVSRDEQVCAVQFIHSFEAYGKTCCYLGPLLSVGGAFFPMFIHWLGQILAHSRNTEVYLAAEFQNPDLFLFFKTLFHTSSFPKIGPTEVPGTIQQVAFAFESHIGHLQQMDVHRLSSSCDEVLYDGKVRHEIVTAWMKSRHVRIGEGQAQLLIVCMSTEKWAEVIADLNHLKNNPEAFKAREQQVLKQFEEYVRKYDATVFCPGEGR